MHHRWMTQGRSEPMSDELWLGLGLGLSAQRQAVGSTSVTLYLNTASSPELLSHTSRRKGKFQILLGDKQASSHASRNCFGG